MPIPSNPPSDDSGNTRRQDTYTSRTQALRARVATAAQSLLDRGINPTVTRVRAALGGGSPNELAPALKHWKESVLPTLAPGGRAGQAAASTGVIPTQIADLTHELWQRAVAAAAVELKGGPTARQVAARTEEANSLRSQLNGLRDQLQRESLAYGELRAQAARHETIAREALARAHNSESRERGLLRKLGEARQTITQLEAAATHRHASPNRATNKLPRKPRPSGAIRPLRQRAPRTRKGRASPRARVRPKTTTTVPVTRRSRPRKGRLKGELRH